MTFGKPQQIEQFSDVIEICFLFGVLILFCRQLFGKIFDFERLEILIQCFRRERTLCKCLCTQLNAECMHIENAVYLQQAFPFIFLILIEILCERLYIIDMTECPQFICCIVLETHMRCEDHPAFQVTNIIKTFIFIGSNIVVVDDQQCLFSDRGQQFKITLITGIQV